jgi:O-succinylbenzoate synthase
VAGADPTSGVRCGANRGGLDQGEEDDVRIRTLELIRVELELVHPLATSQGTHDRRPLVLVRLVTDDAIGTGECAALAEAIYTAETADTAERFLAEQAIPLLLRDGPEAQDAADFFRRLAVLPGHEMAKAGIEMALVDAELRSDGRSLATLLRTARDSIEAGATIGIVGPEIAAQTAASLVDTGFTRIKVKIAPGADRDVLDAVRRAVGFTRIAVDANGAYRSDDRGDLAALRALDRIGLTAIEQPFAREDLVGHAMLRRLIRTPIVLDESITTADDLDRAIDAGAADAVSIKPSRFGGIAATIELCARARSAGLEMLAGGLLESGIGRSVAIAFGATEGFTMSGDLGPSSRYFAEDLTTPHVMTDGMLAVAHGPGIGVEVDDSAISRYATRRSRISAS